MKIDIKKIWSKQELSSSKQVVRERVSFIKNLNCFIGLVGYTGAKMLQLEVDTTVDIHKNYLHKFNGVEIQAIPSENETIQKFTIILIDNELTEIFILFTEDLLDKLIPVTNSEDALTTINQRINYWRRLFARITGEILSPEKQRGLFGELFILQLLLNNTEDKKTALNSWVGSQNASQDFTIKQNAIEVKTSKAGNPVINISNEHQLDFTSWNHIYLCVVVVNESSGSQGTLYELISSIKKLLESNNELVDEFETKLNLAGIDNDMEEDYNQISYSVRNYRFYKIEDGFPVIIKGTFENEAIFNVKYQIEMSKCKDFEEDEKTVLSIIL